MLKGNSHIFSSSIWNYTFKLYSGKIKFSLHFDKERCASGSICTEYWSRDNQMTIGHFRVLASLSVFILWFSSFDLNLFRHRHFRFIIVSVNKNFLYKMDLTSMQAVDLRRFLQEKCVSCFFHQKYHSERLCKLAREMDLEPIIPCIEPRATKNFDTYKNFDLSRQTIKNSYITLEMEIKKKDNWCKNLKVVPGMENYDVMIYLYKSRQWD